MHLTNHTFRESEELEKVEEKRKFDLCLLYRIIRSQCRKLTFCFIKMTKHL